MATLRQLLLLGGATSSAAGQPAFLEFDPMFGDGAVLQMAPARAAVWGRAPTTGAGSVTLSLAGQPVSSAAVGADGTWATTLPPQPASYNHTLSIAVAGGQSKSVSVSFGHVLLCSGYTSNFNVLSPIPFEILQFFDDKFPLRSPGNLLIKC